MSNPKDVWAENVTEIETIILDFHRRYPEPPAQKGWGARLSRSPGPSKAEIQAGSDAVNKCLSRLLNLGIEHTCYIQIDEHPQVHCVLIDKSVELDWLGIEMDAVRQCIRKVMPGFEEIWAIPSTRGWTGEGEINGVPTVVSAFLVLRDGLTYEELCGYGPPYMLNMAIDQCFQEFLQEYLAQCTSPETMAKTEHNLAQNTPYGMFSLSRALEELGPDYKPE